MPRANFHNREQIYGSLTLRYAPKDRSTHWFQKYQFDSEIIWLSKNLFY